MRTKITQFASFICLSTFVSLGFAQSADINSAWQAFFPNLLGCKEGTYALTDATPRFSGGNNGDPLTFIIHGLKGDQCIVDLQIKTAYLTPGTTSEWYNLPINLSCQFPKTALENLVKYYANLMDLPFLLTLVKPGSENTNQLSGDAYDVYSKNCLLK